jgi:hypothetical protein
MTKGAGAGAMGAGGGGGKGVGLAAGPSAGAAVDHPPAVIVAAQELPSLLTQQGAAEAHEKSTTVTRGPALGRSPVGAGTAHVSSAILLHWRLLANGALHSSLSALGAVYGKGEG